VGITSLLEALLAEADGELHPVSSPEAS